MSSSKLGDAEDINLSFEGVQDDDDQVFGRDEEEDALEDQKDEDEGAEQWIPQDGAVTVRPLATYRLKILTHIHTHTHTGTPTLLSRSCKYIYERKKTHTG